MACAVISHQSTNQSVVGYAQSGLKSGFTMITPQFSNIGEGNLPLESLIPVGTDVDTDGGIMIETLDAAGRLADSYMYLDWGDPKGWCDDTYTVVEGVTFAPGTGLWVQGTSADAAIQSAGAVELSDVVVQLKSGFTAMGNPFPVSIDLQDIVPEGEGMDTDGGIMIETLDSAGRLANSYMYLDWGDPVGWCDDTYTVVEGVTFAPGEGLWVQGTKSTESLRFAAPEL